MLDNIVNLAYLDTAIHLPLVVPLCPVSHVIVTIMLQFVIQKLEDVFAITILLEKIVSYVPEDITEMPVVVSIHYLCKTEWK